MAKLSMAIADAQVVGQFDLSVRSNVQVCVWPAYIGGQDPNVASFYSQVTTELIHGFNGTTIDRGRIKRRDNV